MDVLESFVNTSTLTRTQLESLRSYVRVVNGELLLKQAAIRRAQGAVTVGSYYRTVSQGRTKIRESMVTVLIGIWLGLVKLEDVRRLFDLAGEGFEDLSDESTERFVQVLQTILEKVVI